MASLSPSRSRHNLQQLVVLILTASFLNTIVGVASECNGVRKISYNHAKKWDATAAAFAKNKPERQQSTPIPIDESKWPMSFPAKEHCSKCGLCETSYVSKVSKACAFLNEGMGRIDALEEQVHGRRRNIDDLAWPTFDRSAKGGGKDIESSDAGSKEEGRFGVLHRPILLAKGKVDESQWTGCVTGIALSMLEQGLVDAVVCIASKQPQDDEKNISGSSLTWSEPEPIIARTKEDILRGRKVKPALAPSLRVLDEIREDESIKKLLFCGVGCAVQDNSPTPKAAQDFLREGLKVDETKVQGYEFMQDFRVHVKMNENAPNDYITKPYFCLPGKVADSAIADSCLACFDYTNSLADLVVGYMGAPLKSGKRMDESFQTVTVRNQRGEEMLNTALQVGRVELGEIATGSGSHEKFASATVAADSIVIAMTGGEVKQEGMPLLLGEIMASVLTGFVGPKGINFARYSIDYHLLRNYLHILMEWGETRTEEALPLYARNIVEEYLEKDKSFSNLRDAIISRTV